MRKHRNTSYHCETVLCTHSPVPCLLCLSMLQWRPMTRNGINYTRQFLNLFMILHNFVFPYAASHLPGIVSSPVIHLLVLVLLYFHFFSSSANINNYDYQGSDIFTLLLNTKHFQRAYYLTFNHMRVDHCLRFK